MPDRVRLVLAKLVTALGRRRAARPGRRGALRADRLPAAVRARRRRRATTSRLLKLIAGNTAASALYAAIGVGLGALIRNQVGAIIGALGWIFLVEPLLTIIPGFDDVITRWFPTGAANAAAGTATNADALDQVPAALLLAPTPRSFVAAGIVVIRRRDVSA